MESSVDGARLASLKQSRAEAHWSLLKSEEAQVGNSEGYDFFRNLWWKVRNVKW